MNTVIRFKNGDTWYEIEIGGFGGREELESGRGNKRRNIYHRYSNKSRDMVCKGNRRRNGKLQRTGSGQRIYNRG